MFENSLFIISPELRDTFMDFDLYLFDFVYVLYKCSYVIQSECI